MALSAYNVAQMIASDLCKVNGLPYSRAVLRKENGGVHVIVEEAEFEWAYAVSEIISKGDGLDDFFVEPVNSYTLGVYLA